MIKIKKIKDIYDTQYLGVAYPIIEAEVRIDDDEVPIIENFGPESLGDVLVDENGEARTREAHLIDREIYAYVPDDLHIKTHQEIKEWIEKEID